MLIRERRGQLGASEQTIFIKPELVVADTSGGWLGRVFQGEDDQIPDEVEEVNSVLTEVETLAREPNETTDATTTSPTSSVGRDH